MAKAQFTEAQCKAFAEAANPHQWLLTADSLHEQATVLHARKLISGQMVVRSLGGITATWDNANKATFLLCALALENALKSFLVYEHPAWVANGYLHADICSHRLVNLADRCTLIPYRNRDRWVLATFEAGNESWMRYPCGRRANDIEEGKSLPDDLWAAYRRVMRGYGNKLMWLLNKGWAGPHGAGGTWEMAGEWLGGGKPLPANYRPPSLG